MRVLLSLSVVFVLIVSSIGAIAEPHQPRIAQLTVRGEAHLMVPPDQVSVVLGVTTESTQAKKAIAENNRKMKAVVASLAAVGVAKKEYKTQNFRVQPVWSSRPKGANSQWKSTIIAYRVNNSLHVTTQKLALIGDIIGGATSAGANQVNSVNFSLFNERQYRQQAITQAMANAKQDAETLVAASGDTIKRTLTLNLGNSSASHVRVETSMAKSRMMSAQADFTPPPISGGDITVKASVSVVYELAAPK
jgi:uncharacterized protein YggE